MTPQFVANLRIIHDQPLSWTLLWALAAILCIAIAWSCTRIRETEPRPGARTMLMLGGLLCFSMLSVLPVMMVGFKIWAAVQFS